MINAFRSKISEIDMCNTFAFSYNVIEYERSNNLIKELFITLGAAFGAIFIIVTVLNADFLVGFFIILSVILTDLYLYALLYLAGFTLNTVTANNSVIAVGIAVDYSAHIAHAYMMSNSHPDAPKSKKRL